MSQGENKAKLLWFTVEEIDELNQLKEITGDSNSRIVRDAINVYLTQLRKG